MDTHPTYTWDTNAKLKKKKIKEAETELSATGAGWHEAWKEKNNRAQNSGEHQP